ncbi:MAG: hypothetical protein K0S16_399 [Moraxellaceae bacterium]|nr:hypothetical protein [Moraxellaceae bacterium]
MNQKNGQFLHFAPRKAGFALATLLPLAIGNASAFELNLGDVKGSLDTTVSYGSAWRTEAPEAGLAMDYPNYGAAVAANRRTFINKNDGDANFDNDSRPISSVFKITSDLELKYNDFGLFTRGTAFYDTVLMDDTPNRAFPNRWPNSVSCNAQNSANPGNCDFPSEIDNHSGHDARILDAYVYGNFDLGSMPLNVRAGEQVISWGEALFLQDGINSANPVSLSKLRLPGAEVKEALLPLPTLYASLGLTDNLTLETFYQFDWDYSEADDAGTYYSTDDAFAGLGANSVLVDMTGSSAQGIAQAYNSSKYGVPSTVLTNDRLSDQETDSDGQFGVAFRYSLESTEFGLFFMNYHSHKPVAQAIGGEAGGYQAADPNAVAAANAATQGASGGLCPTAAAAASGACGPAMQAAAPQIIGGANAVHYIDTTTYQLVYPEDIQMIGLSFSSTVGELSLSGELAYRPNDVILAELGDNLVAYNTLNAATLGNGGTATAGVAGGGKSFSAGQTLQDWVELETYNLDLVAIYNFGPMLGAEGMTGVLEFGASFIPEGEDQRYASTASLLNLPLSSVPLASQGGCAGGVDYEANTCLSEGPSDDYLDDLSMGYRIVLTNTYNDVFAGVSLSPVLRFAHDFKGNSHRTGNFLENRKAGTVGVNALYNQKLEVGVAYNAFWGAESSNLLSDRDNLTASIKYSF